MARLKLRSRDSREARAALAGTASAAVAEVEAALTVPPDPTAGAFFDVDNTMIAGASIYHFARGLAARKFFTTRDLADFAWQQVKFRVGGRETAEGMSSAREAALAFVAGKRVDEIVRARRGDLRRADGRADLVRHPGAGPAAPRRRPAGLAGHRRRRWSWPRSSPAGSASPARSARSPRSSTASTPGGWSASRCTARRRRRRCSRWPTGRDWTWPAARRTATRSTTCRC